MTLKGHKENISAVQFINNSDLLTASWDHTIKLWDGELGGIKTEIVGNKSFFNHDYSDLNGSVITCSSDRHIRLYDLRSKGKIFLLFTTVCSIFGFIHLLIVSHFIFQMDH